MLSNFRTQFETLLTQKIEASKKWSAPNVNVTVHKLFDYVQYFNSLECDEIFLDGRTTDNVPMIAELRDMIIPNSVRLVAGDRRYDDMLARERVPEGWVEFNYGEWMNTLTIFRGYFKKDLTSNMIYVSDMKVDKCVSDISEVVAVNNMAKFDGVGYIPIWLKDPYPALFNSAVQQTTIFNLLDYYIADLKF